MCYKNIKSNVKTHEFLNNNQTHIQRKLEANIKVSTCIFFFLLLKLKKANIDLVFLLVLIRPWLPPGAFVQGPEIPKASLGSWNAGENEKNFNFFLKKIKFQEPKSSWLWIFCEDLSDFSLRSEFEVLKGLEKGFFPFFDHRRQWLSLLMNSGPRCGNGGGSSDPWPSLNSFWELKGKREEFKKKKNKWMKLIF